MSKFSSYDDLPLDIAYQLQRLEFELQEGDITEKGYEKKKNAILEPYKSSLDGENVYLSKQSGKLNVETNVIDDSLESKPDSFDFGPEPSAADVTDFLDFLPSPTHSPVDLTGAALMQSNHQHVTNNVSPTNTYKQSPTIPSMRPPSNQLPQQHFRPPTALGSPQHQQNWSQHNIRPSDPRAVIFRPFPGNGYPMHPQIINGIRPMPPSSSIVSPLMYNKPSMQPYNGFRPPSNMNGLPALPQMNTQFSQSHSRTNSLDSRPDYNTSHGTYQADSNDWGNKTGYMQHVTQLTDNYQPDSSSVNWRPNVGREPSVFSGKIRPSMSTGSVVSNSTMHTNVSVHRTPSSISRGRSRYRDSYMATSFKAIEPAPQPNLNLNNPSDQVFLSDLAGRQMIPSNGRSVPFSLIDTNDKKSVLTDFKNLAEILRHRSTNSNEKSKSAFILVDSRGKEVSSLTWDKLNARAEKIAHQLKEKGKTSLGDRIALIYRKSEVLEFIPALFGCFLAGVIAVPINAAEDLSELSFILTLTNISLILTTDHNHRAFIKDMQIKSMEFPPTILWWKTNDMGTWYPSKKSSVYPHIHVPDIAYIEYAKASNGELKGVTVSHTSIMEQCASFQASTTETVISIDEGVVSVKPDTKNCLPETMVTYFEPRQQIGMVLSVLQIVYAGNTVIFSSGSIIDNPAAWVYVLSKYKATMALADYTALKSITNYYQAHSKDFKSFSKKITPDLSSLRMLLVDTNTTKPELNDYISEKLLRPLGNTDNPLAVICPILSLPEQGGKILSVRDKLGPAIMEGYIDHEVQEIGKSDQVFGCLFDAQSLKSGKVMVLAAGADAKKSEHLKESGSIYIESFGFCMPKTTVAIVDPNTATFCAPDTLGEVWVSSPSIATGFWALPKHTDAIFHARPLIVSSENSYPEVYNGKFLRTGLNGTVIGGRLFIRGSYEERVRQQRIDAEFGVEDTYYSSELLNTVNKRSHIEQCAIFEILVKNQHLPVIVCESSGDVTELQKLGEEIDEIMIEYHELRMYAIAFIPEAGLPKQLIHGRRMIHSLLTKRHFLQGQLNIKYIKLDVNRTIFNLAASGNSPDDRWLSGIAYEKAIRTGAIIPHHQYQHTGMEVITSVLDDRTEYDISRFTNIVEILQWRATMYPEEISYTTSTLSGNSVNTKSYSWRKLSYMIATVSTYLMKKNIKPGQKIILLMPFGVDYVFSVYTCLSIGAVPIPLELVDPQQQAQRVDGFTKQLIEVILDLGVSVILTNTGGEDVLRHSSLKVAIKTHSTAKFKLPETINISKAPKHHKTLGKESGITVKPEWLLPDYTKPCIILLNTTADGRRAYAYIGHDTILNQCRAQKMTCQLRSQRGIVTTGLGTYEGLGFLYALFCGIYVGSSTVLIPSSDFYANPATFFEALQKYKCKDVFLTNALVQFAMNKMTAVDCRHITLKGVQNVMLVNNTRPKPLLHQHMTRYFARQRLEKEAINTVYSHVGNPVITTRSYMLIEPMSLIIDSHWLRQGVIRPLVSEEEPYGILLNDSGIVPCNTMVAIVNPETCMICPSNVMGEIWVSSDSNVKTLQHLDESAHKLQFEATIVGKDPSIKYMRTGDFGFLWNVRRRVDNRLVNPVLEEGQCLFVLGPINETISRNGLIHFPIDVELSIERCHPAIPSNGSIIFQSGYEIVAVVAVKASEPALSIVPLVVNSVLENHAFLVDTVVMVHHSKLPRSIYGDKMRRKAMLLYASKKLPAIHVKRITDQNTKLASSSLQSQSNMIVSDLASNYDTESIYTTTSRSQPFPDHETINGKESIRQNLTRNNTGISQGSQ